MDKRSRGGKDGKKELEEVEMDKRSRGGRDG